MTAVLPAAAFSVVLGFAAVLAAMVAARAPEPARSYLCFAAGLAMALAVADLIAAIAGGASAAVFAGAITFLIAALVPASLALAATACFAKPVRTLASFLVLVSACAAGLAAAATGSTFLAFAPLLTAALVLAALTARQWRLAAKPALLTGLSAAALLAAAAAYMSGGGDGRTAFGLFFVTGLLGVALAVARRSGALVQRRA